MTWLLWASLLMAAAPTLGAKEWQGTVCLNALSATAFKHENGCGAFCDKAPELRLRASTGRTTSLFDGEMNTETNVKNGNLGCVQLPTSVSARADIQVKEQEMKRPTFSGSYTSVKDETAFRSIALTIKEIQACQEDSVSFGCTSDEKFDFATWKVATSIECDDGYYGPTCRSCPCGTSGECMDGADWDGVCLCDSPRDGTRCEKCRDTSMSGPACDKRVTCVHGYPSDGPKGNGYCKTGTCFRGYTGRNCDTAIPNYCIHGQANAATGNCIPGTCEAAFTGLNCNVAVDVKCVHGKPDVKTGICTPNTCEQGFAGLNCNVSTAVDHSGGATSTDHSGGATSMDQSGGASGCWNCNLCEGDCSSAPGMADEGATATGSAEPMPSATPSSTDSSPLSSSDDLTSNDPTEATFVCSENCSSCVGNCLTESTSTTTATAAEGAIVTGSAGPAMSGAPDRETVPLKQAVTDEGTGNQTIIGVCVVLCLVGVLAVTAYCCCKQKRRTAEREKGYTVNGRATDVHFEPLNEEVSGATIPMESNGAHHGRTDEVYIQLERIPNATVGTKEDIEADAGGMVYSTLPGDEAGLEDDIGGDRYQELPASTHPRLTYAELHPEPSHKDDRESAKEDCDQCCWDEARDEIYHVLDAIPHSDMGDAAAGTGAYHSPDANGKEEGPIYTNPDTLMTLLGTVSSAGAGADPEPVTYHIVGPLDAENTEEPPVYTNTVDNGAVYVNTVDGGATEEGERWTTAGEHGTTVDETPPRASDGSHYTNTADRPETLYNSLA